MVSRPISLQTVDSRHFKILAKTPSKFVEVGPAKSFDSVKAQEVGGMADVAMHVEPIESIPAPNIYDSDKEMEYEGEPEVIIYCKSCGVQCRRIYYHCAKIPSYNLCPCCFCEGRFLMSFYSADFVQLDLKQHGNIRSNKGSSPAWTDQELLYLLEGLEMYGSEDWDAVAKHVGSTRRSREDCIAKFLELPIEENFSSNFKNKSSLSGESLQLNPLFSAENPVMAVLSFLASMVHPNVASAAAQAAIVAYSEKEAQSYQSEDSSNGIYNKEQLESVTNLVLEDAAEKAKQLVGKQDEKINHTLNLLFEVFYKKMELKMQQVTALEDALRQEQVDLEKQKTQILEQKLQIMKTTQELASLQAKKATSTDVSTTASINPSVMHPGKEITLDIVDDTTMNA